MRLSPIIFSSLAGLIFILAITYFIRGWRKSVEAKSKQNADQVLHEAGISSIVESEQMVEESELSSQKKDTDLESSVRSINVSESSNSRAKMAIVDGIKAAEQEEESEREIAFAEERSLGIEESIKDITASLVEYTKDKKKSLISEEEHEALLLEFKRSVEGKNNIEEIDERLQEYLHTFVRKISEAMSDDISLETEKQQINAKLVAEVEKSVSAMKFNALEARRELSKLESKNKDLFGNISKELTDFEKSIENKAREVEMLDRTKGAEPIVIMSRMRQIDSLRLNIKTAKEINDKLKPQKDLIVETYRSMIKILKSVCSNQKNIGTYQNLIRSRKKQVENRVTQLEKSMKTLSDIPDKDFSTKKLPLEIIKSVNIYFFNYSKILDEDLSFDSNLVEISKNTTDASKKMQAYQELAKKATGMQKDFENAIESLTQLIRTSVVEASKEKIDALVESLRKSQESLDAQEGIETYMEGFAEIMAKESTALMHDLRLIINYEKELKEQLLGEKYSSSVHIGSVMAATFNSRLQVDTKQKDYAMEFAKNLKDVSPVSGKTFKESLKIPK